VAGVDPTRTGLTPVQANTLAKARSMAEWDRTAAIMHNAYMVVPGKKKKLKVKDFHPFHAKPQKTKVSLQDMKALLDKGAKFAHQRSPKPGRRR